MKIGYVGLGAMGRALAGHLVGRHDLLVWDLNPQALGEFVKRGAQAAESLADIGAQCDVVLLCLPKSAHVQETLFGSNGLAETLAPGAVVVDQTSGIPSDSRAFADKLAARNIALIDAPVAGGVPSAIAGQITIMASGPRTAFERVLPVLATISPKVYRCSDHVGDGQTVKAINNMINAAYRMVTLEVLAVGRKLGLSAAAMTDALNAGVARSFISYRLLPAVVERRSSTDFALALMVKDLNQAADLGVATATPMPISDVARGMMNMSLNFLGPDGRLDDIVPFMEKLTGADFAGDVPPDRFKMDPALAMQLVIATAATCNRAIAVENTALAFRAGLELTGFEPVISAGSASSAQAELLFAALGAEGAGFAGSVGQDVDSLTEFARVAADCGVPALMVNQVRAQYLSFTAHAGPDRPIQDMINYQLGTI